jgi:hypothetical protein
MRAPEAGMATYRIEVGHANSVKPGNIVGAIAKHAGRNADKTCSATCRRYGCRASSFRCARWSQVKT